MADDWLPPPTLAEDEDDASDHAPPTLYANNIHKQTHQLHLQLLTIHHAILDITNDDDTVRKTDTRLTVSFPGKRAPERLNQSGF